MDKLLQKNWFVLAAIFALAFMVYGNGIGGDFVFDDRSVIVGNPLVEDFSGVLKAFVNPYHYARPQSGLYRPLTFASFTLNWHISQNPASFHVVNIILHALVSFFIFLIIAALKDRRAAAIGYAVFLFLPIHVESVTSIVGRGELLALLFVAAALYASLQKHYFTAAVLFGAALLSKEVSIAFLPVFMFFEFAWRKRSIKEVFWKTLIFCVPIGIYAALRLNALGAQYFIGTGAYSFFNPLKEASCFPSLWTAFKVLALYAQKLIYPTYFSSDYSFNQIPVIQNLFWSWQAMAGIVIFAGLIFIAVVRRDRLLGLGCTVFLCSYFVVSNLVIKTGTIMAERLMYMPSFGFALAVAEIIPGIFNRFRKCRRLLFILFLFGLTVYGIQIARGNTLWKDEKTLFENAYQKAPHSVVNISNIATVLFREGKNEEALKLIDEALRIESKNAPTLHLAGQIRLSMGQKARAEKLWKDAIECQPDYLYPYLSLGVLYYTDGNFQAGENILSKAHTMYATSNVIVLLALNKIGLHEYDGAAEIIENSFGENPKEFELRFALGIAYLKGGLEQRAEELLLDLKDPNISDDEFIRLLKTTEIYQVEMP